MQKLNGRSSCPEEFPPLVRESSSKLMLFTKTQRSNHRRLSRLGNIETKGVPKAIWGVQGILSRSDSGLKYNGGLKVNCDNVWRGWNRVKKVTEALAISRCINYDHVHVPKAKTWKMWLERREGKNHLYFMLKGMMLYFFRAVVLKPF